MYGTASGNSTRPQHLPGRTCPCPRAASRTSGSTSPDAGVRVGQDRRDREDRQSRNRRRRTDAGDAGHVDHREQRVRRDGPGHVGERDDRRRRRGPRGRTRCRAADAIEAGEQQRQPGDDQVLAQVVEDPAGVGPVQRVVEPQDGLVDEVHAAAPRRAHGVISRPMPAITRSSASPSATHRIVPVKIWRLAEVRVQPAEDQLTEAALADDHADGQQRDGRHGRQPDAGDDAGQCQRQLHAEQHAEPAVAHPAGRVTDLLRHLSQAGESVADHQQQGVEHESDENRGDADADERGQEREQRQGWDRVEHAGQCENRRGKRPDPVARARRAGSRRSSRRSPPRSS